MTHWLAATGAAAAAVAVWLARLRWWPYGPCPHCQGRRGHGYGSTGRAWNRCRWCGGSGERLRPGSRIFKRNRDE